MKRFLAAVRFLTILPVPGKMGLAEADMVGSIVFFPAVGLLIGAVAGLAGYGLGFVCGQMVVAVIVVGALAGASGAFHLDGLADTADGFMSARARERMLEIMKDSHVGVMGVVVVVFVVLAKAAALGSVGRELVWRAALLAPVAGRCGMVVGLVMLPSARVGGGLGDLFRKAARWWQAAVAIVILFGAGWFAAGWAGMVSGGVAIAATLAFSGHSYRKIGGATGDTLGATCEIAELAVVLAFAVKPIAALVS